MDMHERINTGEFDNKADIPHNETTDPKFIAVANRITHAKTLLITAENARKELRQQRRVALRDAEAATVIRFRAALEEEFGMTNHGKRAAVWTNAWDRGHSNGFREVLSEYEDLVNLIK